MTQRNHDDDLDDLDDFLEFSALSSSGPALTPDQTAALETAQHWYEETDIPNFRLDGAAGTGKTYCLQRLLEVLETDFVLFTAPTNKAVKVLEQTLRAANIFSQCCTIYSALGLKMMPNGDVKELTESKDGHSKIQWAKYRICVVDEASMLGEKLMPHIYRIQDLYQVRFIFVGDSAQLPPVGEPHSKVMVADYGPDAAASLTTVVRQENQILTLATAIREQVNAFIPRVALANDHDDQEGVWLYPGNPEQADRAILSALDAGLFSQPTGAKCIAWRNVIVNKLNARIRLHLFPNTQQHFVESDRVIVTEPFNPLRPGSVGDRDDTFITTDSEGRVEDAVLMPHPWFPDYQVWRLSITGDDKYLFTAYVLDETDPKNAKRWKQYKDKLAADAKIERRLWGNFWQFVEAFNGVRHGYAITAHRSQGSTYERAFVNYSDMLLNQNRQEAFRCLYVACTRPKKQLHLW